MQENRGLGKQFVRESGRDHRLELFSQRLPLPQTAGQMTWPSERRGGQGGQAMAVVPQQAHPLPRCLTRA